MKPNFPFFLADHGREVLYTVLLVACGIGTLALVLLRKAPSQNYKPLSVIFTILSKCVLLIIHRGFECQNNLKIKLIKRESSVNRKVNRDKSTCSNYMSFSLKIR